MEIMHVSEQQLPFKNFDHLKEFFEHRPTTIGKLYIVFKQWLLLEHS
jgi:hypothetical protein